MEASLGTTAELLPEPVIASGACPLSAKPTHSARQSRHLIRAIGDDELVIILETDMLVAEPPAPEAVPCANEVPCGVMRADIAC